jgi:hypothetical protein
VQVHVVGFVVLVLVTVIKTIVHVLLLLQIELSVLHESDLLLVLLADIQLCLHLRHNT